MNFSRRTLIPALRLILAGGVLSAPTALAQLQEDAQTLNSRALASMEGDQWEDGLQLLTRCIELHDPDAMARFGPQFGVTWYRKGICELRLKRWGDAAKSFEACYRNFPNPDQPVAGGGNPYHKRALLRWGEAAQGAGNHEEAIRIFKKFLEERDKTRDTFDPGSYYINLSICHFKLLKIPEGIEQLETALKNKLRFRTPETGIMAAFQALVGAVIGNHDEQALLAFIGRNRAEITLEPFEMAVYSALFLKLAGDAFDAGMEAGALALYQMVPSTDAMIQDLESRITRLGGLPEVKEPTRTLVKKDLEAALRKLEQQRDEGDPNEVIQLGATALIHERHGNLRGAFAAYEQLVLCFPKSKSREDNLFNLVRTSAAIGEATSTATYGTRFLETYPASKHGPLVRRTMLSALFAGGGYDACIRVAAEMLPKLAEGSEEHDLCLLVLGGSYYHTGRNHEAQPLLDQHVGKYPQSRSGQAALYFQASNRSRLRFWSKAAELLDAFVAKHPDPSQNIYYPFALFDRANCHYAANEHAAALEKLERLEQEFPAAEILDMALNLKGDVLQDAGNRVEAEACYRKALDLADRRGNRIVAGESLAHLVALLGEPGPGEQGIPRAKDAVTYADKFWTEHGGDSPSKTRVALAQVHAFAAVGRGEEALNGLRAAITELAATPGTTGLEEAINAYTRVYLTNHDVDELKAHFDSFPWIKGRNKTALELLRMAIIGASEEQLKRAGPIPTQPSDSSER